MSDREWWQSNPSDNQYRKVNYAISIIKLSRDLNPSHSRFDSDFLMRCENYADYSFCVDDRELEITSSNYDLTLWINISSLSDTYSRVDVTYEKSFMNRSATVWMTSQYQWQIVISPRARRVHRDRKSIRELIALDYEEDIVESVILYTVIISTSSQKYDVSIELSTVVTDRKYQWICDLIDKESMDTIKRPQCIHVL